MLLWLDADKMLYRRLSANNSSALATELLQSCLAIIYRYLMRFTLVCLFQWHFNEAWRLRPPKYSTSSSEQEQSIHQNNPSQIAKYMGPTWGPHGSCRSQMGPHEPCYHNQGSLSLYEVKIFPLHAVGVTRDNWNSTRSNPQINVWIIIFMEWHIVYQLQLYLLYRNPPMLARSIISCTVCEFAD